MYIYTKSKRNAGPDNENEIHFLKQYLWWKWTWTVLMDMTPKHTAVPPTCQFHYLSDLTDSQNTLFARAGSPVSWIQCKHSQWQALNPDTPEFNRINEIWVVGDNRINCSNAAIDATPARDGYRDVASRTDSYCCSQTIRMSFSTVARLSQRHQITGSVNDRPHTGRPRVTTAAQDRYVHPGYPP